MVYLKLLRVVDLFVISIFIFLCLSCKKPSEQNKVLKEYIEQTCRKKIPVNRHYYFVFGRIGCMPCMAKTIEDLYQKHQVTDFDLIIQNSNLSDMYRLMPINTFIDNTELFKKTNFKHIYLLVVITNHSVVVETRRLNSSDECKKYIDTN